MYYFQYGANLVYVGMIMSIRMIWLKVGLVRHTSGAPNDQLNLLSKQ
jgi:hypothetical protein